MVTRSASTGELVDEMIRYSCNEHDLREREKQKELTSSQASKNPKSLMISFGLMVFIGLGNKIFQKLMTIPMYNYPNFVNLLTTFWYVPLSFAYIIPMARAGKIPKEEIDMPKKPFVVMGILDAIAGIMQVFAATYLDGALLILLSQAAIPISMLMSRLMLKTQYTKYQYIGAAVVACGIAVVLGPQLSGTGGTKTIIWAIVMIFSCVPMCLSSIYKEIALVKTDLDPVFLNGWIAIFQFLASIVLAVPSALASDPVVKPDKLPKNLWDGLKCYFGMNSIKDGDNPDDCLPDSIVYVNLYLIFNILYNILIILILKYGSANILWLAMTIMVPLGNLTFAIPGVPGHSPLKPTDIIGLIVICSGLVGFRFGEKIYNRYYQKQPKDTPLLSPFIEEEQ